MVGRLLYKLRSAAWWIIHRTALPFNVVKIRSLSPDYHDKDEIMLHACFQLLVDFVERERGLESWEPHDLDRHIWADLRDLYQWWSFLRPARWAEFERTQNFELENRLLEEDQVNFEKLAKHRMYLWT